MHVVILRSPNRVEFIARNGDDAHRAIVEVQQDRTNIGDRTVLEAGEAEFVVIDARAVIVTASDCVEIEPLSPTEVSR